ncbi:MAG TPA: GNAT family N-acetyltransferase [Nocardioidaceae bacterium]|nr:GNAT family N-acetyltransferase [Nocardioidaceae bacterium]
MSTPSPSTPPGLGPHVVGQRVVVRRVLRGETGPTGGPAFTDVLGVLESWEAGVAVVRPESGAAVAIAIADIVSGKPVPPRPSVRLRVSAEDAEHRALASWPATDVERLGAWVLRAAGGYSSRANSVLAVGDPGIPPASALDRVDAFYGARGLPAWAQVVVGSDEHAFLESSGWAPARPGEADTLFQLASVSAARRVVRRTLPSVVPEVHVSSQVDAAWLADDERALSYGDAAVRVLDGPPDVGFVSVVSGGPAGSVIAKGRVARGSGEVPGDDDWAGIANVWVSPEHRRQGLGTVVMSAMLEWAAERGATTAYLQVRGDNPGAIAAYERLGFMTHHAYRYLTPA